MVNNKSESREEQIRRCGLSVGGMSVSPHNTRFRELNMGGGQNVNNSDISFKLYFGTKALVKPSHVTVNEVYALLRH